MTRPDALLKTNQKKKKLPGTEVLDPSFRMEDEGFDPPTRELLRNNGRGLIVIEEKAPHVNVVLADELQVCRSSSSPYPSRPVVLRMSVAYFSTPTL